jgi:hypothetical protein
LTDAEQERWCKNYPDPVIRGMVLGGMPIPVEFCLPMRRADVEFLASRGFRVAPGIKIIDE